MKTADLVLPDRNRLEACLRDAIFEHRLRPGQIVAEEKWSREFGVTRASVQRVFQTLIVEGVLVRTAGGSVRVPQYSHQASRDYSAELLKAAILAGTLRPGESVVPSNWAREHHLPETCVEESIEMLAKEGFLVEGNGQAARVPLYTAEEMAWVYQVRARLEGLAARLALAARADFAPLATALMHMEAALRNAYVRNAIESELAFHLALGSASGNVRLGESLERLLRPLFVFILLRSLQRGAGTWRPDLQRHREMLSLLREGEPAVAAAFVQGSMEQMESAALLMCEVPVGPLVVE